MSSVLLASASPDLIKRMEAAVGERLLVVPPESLPAVPSLVVALANGSGPLETLVLDPGEGDVNSVMALASRFQQQHPEVSVVVVSPSPAELALTALRSGVRDLIAADAAVEDIRWTLHRAAETTARIVAAEAQAAPARPMGRVLTVASPKGGVGKTTLATNLAVGLAAHGQTVLVDLDVQFGDVAAALDLNPEYTVGDVVRGSASLDAMALKTFLAEHSSGLYVLAGVRTPAEAEAIRPEHISHLLEQLRHEFRYVVIDTAPGLSDVTLTAFDQASDLVLITSMDVPGVRGLRKELELLDELGLHPSSRHIVVNFDDRASGLTVLDVEQAIGRKVDTLLPRAIEVVRSTNQGVPMLQRNGRDKVTKRLQELVSRFTPTPSRSSSRFGRHVRVES
jgi:pilus assembly protein CpaE